MKSYTTRIKEYVQSLPENIPVEVGPVYTKMFSDAPEAAYYIPAAAVKRDYYIVTMLQNLEDIEYAGNCVFEGCICKTKNQQNRHAKISTIGCSISAKKAGQLSHLLRPSDR